MGHIEAFGRVDRINESKEKSEYFENIDGNRE